MKRLLADRRHIDAVLSLGAERARAIAAPIMRDVKDVVGLLRTK
jgi:tryptophanyl-tRNA synthetase